MADPLPLVPAQVMGFWQAVLKWRADKRLARATRRGKAAWRHVHATRRP